MAPVFCPIVQTEHRVSSAEGQLLATRQITMRADSGDLLTLPVRFTQRKLNANKSIKWKHKPLCAAKQ